MLKIYLARHGQDQDNANGILNGRRDTPLTAVGVNQARSVAAKIKEAGIIFDKVYSSPLHRAYKTAEILASETKSPVPEKLDILIERDFGEMTGVPKSEIVKRCSPNILKTDHVTYMLSPIGAESFPDLLMRAKKFLNWLLNDSARIDSVLIVTHGDFGKMIYAAYYNLGWKDVLINFHFGNSELLLLTEDSNPEDTHVFTIKQHNN